MILYDFFFRTNLRSAGWMKYFFIRTKAMRWLFIIRTAKTKFLIFEQLLCITLVIFSRTDGFSGRIRTECVMKIKGSFETERILHIRQRVSIVQMVLLWLALFRLERWISKWSISLSLPASKRLKSKFLRFSNIFDICDKVNVEIIWLYTSLRIEEALFLMFFFGRNLTNFIR